MASSARIDELRKKFDENPRRYFAPLANEYRKSGDLQQAVFICQEYLPQQPGHMSGHIVYGQALFELGRMEEANAVFETALSLDPENLIALRHLGDIARQGGDLRNARIWYQRVLEADPRNEEIAQLMISLLATPEPAPTPPVAREPVYTAPATATPISTVAAARAAADIADDSQLVVEKSEPAPDVSPSAPTPPPPVFVEPPPPPHVTASTKAGDGQDFLNLDDFNLGGVPVASIQPESIDEPTFDNTPFSNTVASDEPFEAGLAFEQIPPPNIRDVAEPQTPPAAEPGFDLGMEDGPFEADPYAIASVPPTPDIELATDIRLGLPDDEESAPTALPESPESPESPEPVAALDGLEPFEPSAPPAFVTETMAELYLRQGHLDAALDIYRQLVEQRPHDPLLQESLRSVEERIHDAAAAAAAPAAPVYGGPTIREFLAAFASRRAPLSTPAVESQPSLGDNGHEYEPQAASISTSSDTVSGSIDALFSGAEASAADVSAATMLQEAFADETPETAPLRGVPAHTASSELSLDHVFKGNAPPPPDNDGFSFDQFFAEEMTETSQHSARDGAAAAAPTDDIAQFNAWLNGLKKT